MSYVILVFLVKKYLVKILSYGRKGFGLGCFNKRLEVLGLIIDNPNIG